MWGSEPLLTVSTADIPIFTLQRLHIFTTSRVKVQKNFVTNHACADQAQYHTSEVWLHRTLQGFYKYSLTSSSPLRFQQLGECTSPKAWQKPNKCVQPWHFRRKRTTTTRDLTLGDVLFMSQKWLFSLCFVFCYVLYFVTFGWRK